MLIRMPHHDYVSVDIKLHFYLTFKSIMSISDVATRGYTGLALYGYTLNIVEENTYDQLTCATVVLPQTVMNDGNKVIPIVNGTDNLIRGTISYNKTSGKLVFVDETGQTHNIAFED